MLAAAIAPLRRMTSGHDCYDYLTTEKLVPGQLVAIPFQKHTEVGLVLRVLDQSPHATKKINSAGPVALTANEVEFLEKISAEIETGLGTVANHFLGNISWRRWPNFLATTAKSAPRSRRYFWFTNPIELTTARTSALRAATHERVVVVAPSEEVVAEYQKILLDSDRLVFILDSAAHGAGRRKIIRAWQESTTGILLATHLGVWLPFTPAIFIFDEPTNPYHTQWDGPDRYRNRQIFDARQKICGGAVWLIAHTPDTADLAAVKQVPKIKFWPQFFARANDERGARLDLISSQITAAAETAQNIAVIVPHLQTSREVWCADCKKRLPRATAGCPHCHGVALRPLGFDLPTLQKELARKNISTNKKIVVLDKARAATTFSSAPTIFIATAPVWPQLPWSQIDLVIDLSADFPLYGLDFTAETAAIARLRAAASQLPKNWPGQWLVTTDYGELTAWQTNNVLGWQNWWHKEQHLRERFSLPPFGPWPPLPSRQKSKIVLS